MDARLVAAARVPESARSFLRAASIVRASNAWVVGPERSASGRPLLANDMHLGLRAPTLWYLVGLHAPGLEVVGMSLPGTPGVIAGHGRAVAWGFTNASLDDTDLFRERVDPIDTTRYLIPGGSEPFRVRQEEIRVRGRAEPVTVRVRETRHGPVIGDVEARAGGELLALRWVALDASTTPAALLAMNAAASAGTFVEALRGFVDPHQNVVFADTAGVWGYWMAGRVPRRRGGTPPLLPVPGWTGEHDWDGYLGFDEHPHALSPPAGVVVTANHRQTRAPVGARISDGAWTEPYRALRILELLEGRELHDAGTMAAIQLDVGSAFVNRHRAAAESAFREAGLDVEAGALEAWDGRATLEDTATGLFHAWFGRLRTALSEELYGRSDGFVPRAAVERALVEGRFPGETLRGAARAARDDTAGRPWGELHRLWLDHPLADVPVVGSLFGFGRGDLPREGGPHTVNVAGFDGRGVSFRVYDGPSQRHVVDLADPDGSGGFILPGGQSGFPGSPHHMDQLPRWARGELVPLPLERTAVEARTVTRLRLVPPG
jgi:penicillin amidase